MALNSRTVRVEDLGEYLQQLIYKAEQNDSRSVSSGRLTYLSDSFSGIKWNKGGFPTGFSVL